MVATITEKPSAGQEIARVVGVIKKKNGYVVGNGYVVTWALEYLASLTLPKTYDYMRTVAEDLPVPPEPFRFAERQMRVDKGMMTDIAAGRQLKVIDGVSSECNSIIVTTDTGCEGELIFRWTYPHLGRAKPFRRLWFPSLVDEAVRKGMADLREGCEYDSLYTAADSKAKAGWPIGMNVSRASVVVSSPANNSIGRVQTPTLAMICARLKENRNFVSTPYWQLYITLKQEEAHRLFIHPEHSGDKRMTETVYGRVTPDSTVTITKVECGTVSQQAPSLYDLTSLQKDYNIRHDLTADKTPPIAQPPYEKELVSYPETGNQHIPEDIMASIPALLEKVIAMPLFGEYGHIFDFSALDTQSVNTTKVTDHRALIITGAAPEKLSGMGSTIYTLIAGRMLGAFSPPCGKERLLMGCMHRDMNFRSRSAFIVNTGWQAVSTRKEDREKNESRDGGETALFTESGLVPLSGRGLSQKETLPKPFYMEVTLFTAMESCGKDITDGEARETIRDSGTGAPVTRVAIITALFECDCVERPGEGILPTEKRLYLYELVRDMMVVDAEPTGTWERALTWMEGCTLGPDNFIFFIRRYTGKVTGEVLCLEFPEPLSHAFTHLKYKAGSVVMKSRVAKCDREGCGLLMFHRFLSKELTDRHLERLFSSDSTRLIGGLKGKKGCSFDTALTFDDSFNLKFSFPKPEGTEGK